MGLFSNNDVSFERRRDRIWSEVEWHYPIAPDVIQLKFGGWMRCFEYLPYNRQGHSAEAALADLSAANNALRRLGWRWAVYSVEQRRRVHDYPESTFPCAAAQHVDIERGHFFSSGQLFENRCSLAFVYTPKAESLLRVQKYLTTGNGPAGDVYAAEMDYFRTMTDGITDMLAFFPMMRVLKEGDLLRYLKSFVSTRDHPVGWRPDLMDIAAHLCDMPGMGGVNPYLGNEIRDPETDAVVWSSRRWLRTVSLLHYPDEIRPLALSKLSDKPIEFDRVSRWMPVDREHADATLKAFWKGYYAQRKSLYAQAYEAAFRTEVPSFNREATKRVQQIENAINEISDGVVSMGYFGTTFTVMHEDFATACDQANDILTAINGAGFTAELETDNAAEAAFGRIPGNVFHDVNRPFMNSANALCTIPFNQTFGGFPEIPDHNQLTGPARIFAVTRGHNRKRLTLFDQDLGHMALIGNSGAGKTFLMNLLAFQWLRYPGAVHIRFDRKRGGRIAAMCAGGVVVDPVNDGSGVQPLRHCDEQEQRLRCADWIREVVKLGLDTDRLPDAPRMEAAIEVALDRLAKLKPDQRTITAFRASVPDEDVKRGLGFVSKEGQFGALFDCAVNRDLRDAHWISFELDTLFKSPRARDPMLAHLIFEVERLFDGRPIEIAIDELWQMETAGFLELLDYWIRRLRSFNVHVVLASQSIKDIAGDRARIIHDNCHIQVYAANRAAMEPGNRALYEAQDLIPEQIDLIRSAVPKQDYVIRHPDGTELVSFAVPRRGVQAAVCATDEKLVRQALDIERRSGSAGFLAAWYRHHGLDKAARAIENGEDIHALLAA